MWERLATAFGQYQNTTLTKNSTFGKNHPPPPKSSGFFISNSICYNSVMIGKTENRKVRMESYKGVRDFYPEDQFVQNYIFGVMGKVARQFGYQEYGASVLEPAELYRAKSGEEIVNEQTYTFTDRGDREVTLRPEMTPSLA